MWFTDIIKTWLARMAHAYRLGVAIWRYQARIPVGPDTCHLGCAYTALQTFQMNGVYSAAYTCMVLHIIKYP